MSFDVAVVVGVDHAEGRFVNFVEFVLVLLSFDVLNFTYKLHPCNPGNTPCRHGNIDTWIWALG